MTALDEIRGRWQAATPGPWFAWRYFVGAGDQEDPDEEIATTGSKLNATAIAHAPTDVARLLAALEAVTALADTRATELRETADRLNQLVIDRDPQRDPDAALRYGYYAVNAEATAYQLRRAVSAALEGNR